MFLLVYNTLNFCTHPYYKTGISHNEQKGALLVLGHANIAFEGICNHIFVKVLYLLNKVYFETAFNP